MTINNWDPDKRAFKYSDSDTFNPWKDVELRMGYFRNGSDERRKMLTGEITTLGVNFPSSGGPTLTVRGLNLLHRFRTKQLTRSFFKKTDTEVAKILVDEIAAEIRKNKSSLKLELDSEDIAKNKKVESPVEFLFISNQYPIIFLMERARRIGYELSIQEIASKNERKVIFHFRPSSDVNRNTYILKWGVSLISFQPTLRTADQVSKVTVRGWSPNAKKAIEKSATRTDIADEGVVKPSDLKMAEPSLAQEIAVDMPVASAAEAEQLAKKILRQKAAELITGKGKTVGLPELRAGVKVRIDGLGRFSGTYLVTDTTHTIGDSGYTTDFTARMEGGIG
jgi:phage protein D